MNLTFKNSVATVVLAAAMVAQSSNAMASGQGDGSATALLDLSTGEIILTLDAFATVFLVTGIDFDNDALNLDSGLGGPLQNDDTTISFLYFISPPAGDYNLGPIIPAAARNLNGVSQFAVLSGNVTRNVGDPGVTVIGIPEPGSFACLVLASIGCVMPRRRRFC